MLMQGSHRLLKIECYMHPKIEHCRPPNIGCYTHPNIVCHRPLKSECYKPAKIECNRPTAFECYKALKFLRCSPGLAWTRVRAPAAALPLCLLPRAALTELDSGPGRPVCMIFKGCRASAADLQVFEFSTCLYWFYDLCVLFLVFSVDFDQISGFCGRATRRM